MRTINLHLKNLLGAILFTFLVACGSEESASTNDSNNTTAVPVESTSSTTEATSNENDDEELLADNEATSPAASEELDGPRVENGLATIDFAETSFDFGTVKDGEIVTHSYTFTNTGSVPLVIENATASCGCTVPDWPKKPILPGEEGKINVEFNSTNRPGRANKSVTITANTNPPKTFLQLSGTVTR